MRYSETGLPANKAAETAFNLLKSKHSDSFASDVEATVAYFQQLKAQHVEAADHIKTEHGEQAYKDAIDSIDRAIKMAPESVAKSHANELRAAANVVEVLLNNVDPVSDELMASVFLTRYINYPTDALDAADAVGKPAARFAASYIQMFAEGQDKAALLAAATPDMKALFMAETVTSFENMTATAKKGGRIQFDPRGADRIIESIKPVWGNSQNLDTKFVTVINEFFATIGLPHRVTVDPSGKPKMKGAPKKPSGTTGFGKNVF